MAEPPKGAVDPEQDGAERVPRLNVCAKWAFHAWLVVVFYTFLTLRAPAEAEAQSCAVVPKPAAVNVATKDTPRRFDTDTGLRTLTRKMRSDGKVKADSIYNMGVTRLEWGTEANIELTGEPNADSSYCWSVVALNVTVTVEMTVYIAKEIERDSCTWREVLKHEQKHVALNEKAFAGLPDDIRPVLAAAIKGSVASSEGQKALATFRKRAEKALSDAIKEFAADREKQHREKIDTKEEYARVDAACSEAEWAEIFKRAGLR